MKRVSSDTVVTHTELDFLQQAPSNQLVVSGMWLWRFVRCPLKTTIFLFFALVAQRCPKSWRYRLSFMIRKNDTMMLSVTVRTCLLVHHRTCCGGGGPRFCRMLKRTYPKCTRPITTRCLCVRFGVIRANMCVGRHVISHFEVTEGEMLAKINCKRDEVTEKVVYTEDILAVFTHHTKAVLFGIGELWRQFQKSAFFKWVR